MTYTGELKIGAVYQSSMIALSRRVTRIRHGNVEYVLYQKNARTVPRCALTEEMFRAFTTHEIPPEEIR